MILKRCTCCNVLKWASEFSKDADNTGIGLRSWCKSCSGFARKKYHSNNKHVQNAKSREYRMKHRDEVRQYNFRYNKAYYGSHKAKIKKQTADYYQHNKKHCISRNLRYRKGRLAKDVKLKTSRNIANAVWRSLKGNKNGCHWEGLVGYGLDELIRHLKTTLPDGFVWNDYINGGKLHIDHIIPISAHNFRTADDIDFKRCWALSNLRLIPAKDNLSKGDKINRPFQPAFAFGGS